VGDYPRAKEADASLDAEAPLERFGLPAIEKNMP
jgi:hypothetical protein